jgi:tetrapyrrole methylase family protein/MazG family protein
MAYRALERVFDLIRVLRAEDGCPWDRAQTVEDILSDLIEETYELQWAYANNPPADVLEEMGDVVFVLVFAIALLQEEDPTFTLDRITDHAVEKIRRRHPHVFGDADAKTKVESLTHWARIKAEERSKKTGGEPSIDDIPGNFPPIRRAEKIQKFAARSGFDWSDTSGILRKIREEVDEVEETLADERMADADEEIGDLFFSVINLSRFLDIDGERTLTRANAKFIRRYMKMEELARGDGHRLGDLSLEEMERYWERTKRSR